MMSLTTAFAPNLYYWLDNDNGCFAQCGSFPISDPRYRCACRLVNRSLSERLQYQKGSTDDENPVLQLARFYRFYQKPVICVCGGDASLLCVMGLLIIQKGVSLCFHLHR